MEILQVVLAIAGLCATVAMPFMVFILNGIRRNLHELRAAIQPLAVEQGRHEVRISHLEKVIPWRKISGSS